MTGKLLTFLISAGGAFTALTTTDISTTIPDNISDVKTLVAAAISVAGAIVSQLVVALLRKVFKLNSDSTKKRND